MKTHTIEISGIPIRYVDTQGAGPVFVMSSGIGQSLEFFEPQIQGLGDTARVIAWDFPSHGGSGLSPNGYDLDSLASIKLGLMDALGVSKAVMVGNSLGGAVSIRMLKGAPDRVAGLVLAAPALNGKEVTFAFRLMSLPILGNVMTKPSEKGVEMQLKSVFAKSFIVSPQLKSVVRRNTMKEGAQKDFLAFMRATLTLSGAKDDIWKEQNRLVAGARCPVHYVHGKDDAVLPYTQSTTAAKLTPQAKVTVYDECGHAPQLEKPQKFNAVLREIAVKL